ncbi:uncharacterized protein VNE69_12018 [Vairimorpha necatrix]|uniref:Uncharacterized protein n=1 Tax=Vairimorpha necatrix TaxID=6039 RepID=A0AAX4JGL2_9MICR
MVLLFIFLFITFILTSSTTENITFSDFFLSKQRSKRNKEFNTCHKIFFEKNPEIFFNQYYYTEDIKIARIIYKSLINDIKFPLKIKDHEISRGNMRFIIYFNLLKYKNMRARFTGKKQIIMNLLHSLADKTYMLYNSLLCINFNVKIIEPYFLEMFMDKIVDIRIDEDNEEFETVYNLFEYKNIMKNIENIFKDGKLQMIRTRPNENYIDEKIANSVDLPSIKMIN